MNTAFRIERALLKRVHSDLSREHPFAAERVGFIACEMGSVNDGALLLAHEYLVIDDEDYEYSPSPDVGAMMGPGAIRKALQYAYNSEAVMLHVHRHDHVGCPQFSRLDLKESAKFVPDFWKVRPNVPHGTLVLSRDAMFGLCWDPASRQPTPINQLSVIGRPLSIFGRWWQ